MDSMRSWGSSYNHHPLSAVACTATATVTSARIAASDRPRIVAHDKRVIDSRPGKTTEKESLKMSKFIRVAAILMVMMATLPGCTREKKNASDEPATFTFTV